MDAARFDTLVRSLARHTSRRAVLAGLGGGLAALLTLAGLDDAIAKKGKNNKKKPKLNEFGCVNVGGKCRGKDSLCCSGICDGQKPKKGKKDKSKCVAHNVLDCPSGADECQGESVACGTTLPGTCFQTTGRDSYCAFIGSCKPCQKDADCGVGRACAVCPGCGGMADTACLAPGA
jgi:hypothetical protein